MSDLLYDAVGISSADFDRPMFPDLFQAGVTIALFGMDPAEAFNYNAFKPDVNVRSEIVQSTASLLGFDLNRIGEDGYTGPALQECIKKGSALKDAHPMGHLSTLIIAVAIVRYVCELHPSYKSDFLKLMKTVGPALQAESRAASRTAASKSASAQSAKSTAAASSGGCLMTSLAGIAVAASLPLMLVVLAMI